MLLLVGQAKPWASRRHSRGSDISGTSTLGQRRTDQNSDPRHLLGAEWWWRAAATAVQRPIGNAVLVCVPVSRQEGLVLVTLDKHSAATLSDH